MAHVLVLIDHYLPGSKYGGTLRTVSNLIEALGDEHEFFVLTQDRDLDEPACYPNVTTGQWSPVGKARVYYASPDQLSGLNLSKLIREVSAEVSPDVILLNGLFSKLTMRSLALRRLGLFQKKPILISPRGQLSPGSLQLKSKKKKAYLWLTSMLGLYNGLNWLGASPDEMTNIRDAVAANASVYFSPNIPIAIPSSKNGAARKKVAGEVRLVSLSRISPVKNLLHTIQMLESVSGSVQLDIYGHVDEEGYWQACQFLASRLPETVQVNYMGPVEIDATSEVFKPYHFFISSTLGESFGHAIFEALLHGCPVIISDTTPWRDLEITKAGFALSLQNAVSWQEVLQTCIDMDQEKYDVWSQGARRFAEQWLTDSKVQEQASSVFSDVLTSQPGNVVAPPPHVLVKS